MFDDIIKPKRQLKAKWTFESPDLPSFFADVSINELSNAIIKELNKEIVEDIYIKPVKAAEFIVFNFAITKTGELVGET